MVVQDYYQLNYDSKGRLIKEFFYEGNKWKEEIMAKKKIKKKKVKAKKKKKR
jgi:hypothetical protein